LEGSSSFPTSDVGGDDFWDVEALNADKEAFVATEDGVEVPAILVEDLVDLLGAMVVSQQRWRKRRALALKVRRVQLMRHGTAIDHCGGQRWRVHSYCFKTNCCIMLSEYNVSKQMTK